MTDVRETLARYKQTLEAAQEQHRKTVDESNRLLEQMIHDIASSYVEEPKPAEPTEAPQSVWVTGNDGEKFLMLNESAVNLINDVFERIQDVIKLLQQKQKAPLKSVGGRNG